MAGERELGGLLCRSDRGYYVIVRRYMVVRGVDMFVCEGCEPFQKTLAVCVTLELEYALWWTGIVLVDNFALRRQW